MTPLVVSGQGVTLKLLARDGPPSNEVGGGAAV
jgi:hypothetical protein